MFGIIFLYTFNTFLSGLVITLIAVFTVLGIRIVYNKLYKKPNISLKLDTNEGWTKEKHFRGEDSSDTNQDFHEVHTYFQIIWKFTIILKNISRAKAHKIRLLQLKDNSNFKLLNGEIDEGIVFEFNQKVDLPFGYDKTFRVKRRDQNEYFTGLPEGFNDLILLVEYSNVKNKTFYRKYHFRNDKTVDSSMSEEDLEQWVYL